jgi:hypothetical protein
LNCFISQNAESLRENKRKHMGTAIVGKPEVIREVDKNEWSAQ